LEGGFPTQPKRQPTQARTDRAGRPEAVWSGSRRVPHQRRGGGGAPAWVAFTECDKNDQPGTEGCNGGTGAGWVVTSYHIRESSQLQALFHSLRRVLCTIRSLYFCTIGSASHIEAKQASNCQVHAALSSNTTPREGRGRFRDRSQAHWPSRPARVHHPASRCTIPG